jgi:catechol 2,3-dioxygenase-like lactoylglutathione lyase family enzyme
VDLKLEVVVIPVSDVDRAKDFYTSLGWRLDADFPKDDLRVVQVTPPGSPTSVIFGSSVTDATPGSAEGMQLVTADIEQTREELVKAGIEVSEVWHDAGGVFHHGGDAKRVAGKAPANGSYGSWLSFADPDGNTWYVQEVTTRLPGRVDTVETVYSSRSDLEAALKRAAAAHGEHEARTGEADPEWPAWYSDYMVKEFHGEELPQ